MSWFIIGTSVGAILALTGAGGAVLAIPLFMTLLNMSLKEATTASLLVVAASAIIGSLSQDGKVNLKVVMLLFFASTFGAWAAYPLKLLLSAWILKVLLATLALYSMWVMWRKKSDRSGSGRSLLWHLPGGLVLGGLTTLTGLGGGVILLPWLKITTGKTDIVTSLATIAMISSFSFGMQISFGAKLPLVGDILITLVSIIISTYLVKRLLQKLKTEQVQKTRVYTFTMVVIFTLITLFGRSA